MFVSFDPSIQATVCGIQLIAPLTLHSLKAVTMSEGDTGILPLDLDIFWSFLNPVILKFLSFKI